MELKEAIKMLNDCGTNISSEFEDEVLELINKALEHKEPKEPMIAGRYSDPECPNCMYELSCYYSESKGSHVGDNFCPECGQALKW